MLYLDWLYVYYPLFQPIDSIQQYMIWWHKWRLFLLENCKGIVKEDGLFFRGCFKVSSTLTSCSNFDINLKHDKSTPNKRKYKIADNTQHTYIEIHTVTQNTGISDFYFHFHSQILVTPHWNLNMCCTNAFATKCSHQLEPTKMSLCFN